MYIYFNKINYFLYFFLDDAGCRLKVKCRPVRSDGFSGEIFTSASSLKIEGGNPSDDESDSD